MKGKLLLFSFLSILLESVFVRADAFSGSSFAGSDPVRLNLNFGFLANPALWAVLASVALVGFILFVLSMKVPFFEGNKWWAGIFAFLLAIISITTTPVVVWVALLGATTGLIVAAFFLIVAGFFLITLLRGVKKNANIMHRDDRVEDKANKVARDAEKDVIEDTGRYKRVIKMLGRTIKEVKKLNFAHPDFATQSRDIASRIDSTLRVRLTGDRAGDDTGDGEDADDELRQAVDALNAANADSRSNADRRLDEARKILKKHKR
jgi:hypothetical protein